MAIGGVVINFVAKTADAVSDIGKLNRKLDDTKDAGKKAGGKGGIGGLVSSMGAAVPIVGAVVIGAVGAAGALIDMGKAAMEDKKQADNLANTLKNIPGITQKMIDANEEWITSMQLATLVSDTDLRVAIGKLTLATGDLEEAQDLAALAADAAAGSGKEYSTVADAMAKAAGGNTSQLKRMYPWLDKNKDGTLTLKEAQEGLGGAFKGAAEEAANNDPWKRIKVIFDELKEAIGTSLLPVLDDLRDWFKDPKNRKKLEDFLGVVQDLAYEVGTRLRDALRDLIEWLKKPENRQKIKDWVKAFGDLAESVMIVVGAIKTMIGWIDRIPTLPTGALGLIKYALSGGGGGGGSTSGGGDFRASTMGATAATAPAPAPAAPTVIVTEEQVYRAVQRLLMRGQARNGRLVMVG